jgi:hypothetical protein
MKFNRQLAFAKDQSSNPIPLEALEGRFSRPFDGTNFYYGINELNTGTFATSRNALNETHQQFYEHLLDLLKEPGRTSVFVMLGVEPPQIAAPYDFVDRQMPMLNDLAERLDAYQKRAPAGKSLEITIRYASEMNDKKTANAYAGDHENYKRTFIAIRKAFRGVAPAVRFAFSPAIRADLASHPGSAEADLTNFWPGTENVDVIGATWYVGDDDQFDRSCDFMRRYILHRQGAGLPYGIDEMGGKDSRDNNERMLGKMYGVLKDIGMDFDYATIFLEGKWGATVSNTLAFLPPKTSAI